jgi:HlyD family secretion protein
MLNTNRRRLMLWLPLGAALLLLFAWLFWPRAIQVDLGAVTRGPLEAVITEEGETRVRDVFVVSAPSSGLLWRVELRPGDEVRAGDTIVARIGASAPGFLDTRTAAEARAARDTAAAGRTLAEAQLRRAEAEFDFATAELRRLREPGLTDSISRSALDAAESRARSATAVVQEVRAGLAMRNSEFQQAQARLRSPSRSGRAATGCDCTEVRSPVSGRVLRVVRESESVVTAGLPILELGDLKDLEIEVELLSEDAVRVAAGQRVRVEGWGGEQPLAARVRRVEPSGFTKVSALGVEEQRVRVLIDLEAPLAQRPGLGHGYRVQARIVTWESPDTLRVPLAALFRDGEGWAVFVAARGRARLRPVVTGHRGLDDVEIQDGLVAGEAIVLHPNDRVRDGGRVTALPAD